jgi:hypothetical protein
MKRKLLSMALGVALLASCSNDDNEVSSGIGTLSLKYGVNTGVILKATDGTTPDPTNFKLNVLQGEKVMKTLDPIGETKEVELNAGDYTVKIFSEEFTTPAFEKPVYGAEKNITIKADETTETALSCVQSNAGVKFNWSDEFKAAFSEFSATVASGSNQLDYSSTETRIGYFPVGEVTVKITVGTESYSKTLTLNEKEVVTVKPEAAEAGTGSLKLTVTVSTDVTDREETFVVGGSSSGGNEPSAKVSEDFSSGTKGETVAVNGWSSIAVSGSDKSWEIGEYDSNKYAIINAYGGSETNYDLWLISPALDLDNATEKYASFKTAGKYWNDNSSLEVYILDAADPSSASTKTLLTATVSKEADGGYTWVSSGDIDLSAYSGTKYIGFRYQAASGNSGYAATYELDDFSFGVKSGSSGNPGGETGTAILSEDFASASAGTATEAGSSKWTGNENFPTVETVYQAGGSVKLGSSKGAATMQTKALDLSANDGKFTVSFKVKGWYADNKTVIIAVSGMDEKTVSFESTGKAGDLVSVSESFTGGAANSTITIKTDAADGKTVRVFIDDFKVTETE